MQISRYKINYLSFIILLIIVFLIIYPFVIMIKEGVLSEQSNIDNLSIILQPRTIRALENSFLYSIIATFISLSLGFLLAYGITKCNIFASPIYRVIFIIPMLIPTLSIASGLVNVLGDNGLLYKIFGISIGIYGFKGLILGSIIYSFPVAFLMYNNLFLYEDKSLYESARTLKATKLRIFFDITLEHVKKPTILIFFAVFTMIFTDYGIPFNIAGRIDTLPMLLYTKVLANFQYAQGAVIALLLLLPAFVSSILDLLFVKDNNNEGHKEIYSINSKLSRIFFTIFCFIFATLIIIYIFGFFIVVFVKNYPFDLTFSLKTINEINNNGIINNITNSIIISISTAILGTGITYITAYIVVRYPIKPILKKTIHFCSKFSIAIPGIVLGIGYIIAFSGTFLYQTFIILICANIAHFFTIPYVMASNVMDKTNKNFESVGLTLKSSEIKTFFYIILPITKSVLIEMATYFFINSMITISAISFLVNIQIMPLSVTITRYDELSISKGASVALIILFINIIAYSVGRLLQKRWDKYSYS